MSLVRVAEADSLYAHARVYSPTNKKAILLEARHFFEYGSRDRGMDRLRSHDMLLDVPQFPSAPELDGRLDEPVWDSAASIDQLYHLNWSLRDIGISLPADNSTRIYVGYDSVALYVGAVCHDPDPGEIVVDNMDGGYPRSDQLELLVDPPLDRTDFGRLIIDTRGQTNSIRWLRSGGRKGLEPKE